MHVDPTIVATLEGARLTRALRHARGCETCRGPVERVLLATRVLERGSPWEPTEVEVEAASASGLDAALAAARPRRRWPLLAGVGVALAAAASLVVIVTRPPEFAERGGGDGRAVLRMFCATEQAGLAELPSGAGCPAGARLAFAAAAVPELASVAVKLSGPEGRQLLGPFQVSGRPGAEVPLEATPRLSSPGTVEVTAAFAATPEAALSALRGERVAGAVLLHQHLRVEGAR
ncbi:MAG TPA: hypothetical protein VML50_03555 [Anaeromyxobacter sp.]|nr:hypothetical protein [Anaeromyxobacter sp.]